jgi:hypothetical protein
VRRGCRPALAGCIDVDIGITPATNTLELEIDEAGLVLDYPEMFRRIAVTGDFKVLQS